MGNEASLSAFSLLDQLSVLVEEGGGENTSEILQQIRFAITAASVNELVIFRDEQVKDSGTSRSFRDDVEAVLACCLSPQENVRQEALLIIKEWFQLPIGVSASEDDELRYVHIIRGFCRKGPRIIVDMLVQNIPEQTEILLKIIVLSSANTLLRGEYIQLMAFKPLMLYVIPVNKPGIRILATEALTNLCTQV